MKSHMIGILPLDDQGQSINASKAGTPLKAPLTAEFILMRDDVTLEGPSVCSSGQGTCWRLASTGKVITEKIKNGTVTFTPVQGGGTAGTTKNIGNGKYQTTYTTGPQPMVNKVGAGGTATINVPKDCSWLMRSILGIISMLITSTFVLAASIDNIHLLKISPQDERAVVKMEDRAMKIIKPGDAIGKNGKVVEITSGRVVIEEQTDGGRETIIIRFEQGRQTVERLKKTPDTQPEIYKLQ